MPAPTAVPTQVPTPEPVGPICPAAEVAPGAASEDAEVNVPPNIFIGTPTIDGQLVPDGTNVTACVGGEPVAFALVSEGQFFITVQQGAPGLDGKEVTFSIDGLDARETQVWSQGGAELIDLSAER
jgi:hypothetical protein